MTETISQEMYAALEARAAADPRNADKVALYWALQMQIENGTRRVVENDTMRVEL